MHQAVTKHNVPMLRSSIITHPELDELATQVDLETVMNALE